MEIIYISNFTITFTTILNLIIIIHKIKSCKLIQLIRFYKQINQGILMGGEEVKRKMFSLNLFKPR